MKLIVELDGGVHEETAQAAHDVNRDANLTNEEVFNSPKSVLNRIAGTASRAVPTKPTS